MANNALKMAFILSATDKMSRVIDAAVKKSTDKLSAFERNASKVGRGMVKSGALIMGAGAAVGGAVFSAGKSVADYAGSVKDASESTGVNTEAWQKMTYAAKISGIEQEKLMTWMVKFDKVLTDAAGGSKTAGQIFKDLGISVKDASGKMRAPEAVFEDVAELLANVEDGATKTAAACAFFGKSGAELLPMLNEGRNGLQGLYRTAEETGNVLANETLTAADEFGKSLDAVKLQAQGVMLQLGSALIPVLSEMKDWLSGVIGKVGDWLKANPELTKTIGKVATAAASILLVLGTASVVIGGVTFAIGKFVSMWKGLMTAIKVGRKVVMMFNKTLLTSPVFWIIVGIVALSVVVYKLIKNWDKVSAFFKRLWDGIKKIFAAVWDWIKNMFLNYTPAGLVIKHWDSIKGWFSGLWDGVKNVFRATWDWIKKMFLNYTPQGLVIKHWDSIKGWFSGLWDGVKNVFRATWDWIKKMFLNYTPQGLVIKHWDSIKGWFSGLWDGVKNVFRATWDWIKKMFLNYTPQGLVIKHWDSIKGWFSGLWDGVKGVFVGAWDGIKGFFAELNPVEWLSDMWNGISEFFSGLWQRFHQGGRQIIQGLIDGITGMATKAIEGIKNISRKIANGFKSFFGIHSPSKLFAEYGANITAGLTVGIDGGTGKVERSTSRMAERANRGFSRNIDEGGSRIGQVNRALASENRAATVPVSQIANTVGGTSITYAPQITVEAGAAGTVEPDLRKLLKEHERDILEMIERAAANRARLSFA